MEVGKHRCTKFIKFSTLFVRRGKHKIYLHFEISIFLHFLGFSLCFSMLFLRVFLRVFYAFSTLQYLGSVTSQVLDAMRKDNTLLRSELTAMRQELHEIKALLRGAPGAPGAAVSKEAPGEDGEIRVDATG